MNFLFFSYKEKYLFASVPGFCAFLRSHTVLINVTIIEGLIGLNETIVIMIKIIRICRFFSQLQATKTQKTNLPASHCGIITDCSLESGPLFRDALRQRVIRYTRAPMSSFPQ